LVKYQFPTADNRVVASTEEFDRMWGLAPRDLAREIVTSGAQQESPEELWRRRFSTRRS
jgi:hypothetical protein